MQECTEFQGKVRTINIPQVVSTKFSQFGILLLNDPNGTRVHDIEDKCNRDVERVNTEILREWVTGRGKKPVNWETLIKVLRDTGLHRLASEIEEVKLVAAQGPKEEVQAVLEPHSDGMS